MKKLILLFLLICPLLLLGDHVRVSDRRYHQIAEVDKRVETTVPYLFKIFTFDSESMIQRVCGGPDTNSTNRGCVKGYLQEDGTVLYRVLVLSSDYAALMHELNHIIYGPCHINAAGSTPIRCQEWLIKNNLPPIGTQQIDKKEDTSVPVEKGT